MRKGAVRKTTSSTFAAQQMVSQQPVQQMQQPNPFMVQSQPIAQQQGTQPMQQTMQPQQPVEQPTETQAPPDWLTPKVYKGSSLL